MEEHNLLETQQKLANEIGITVVKLRRCSKTDDLEFTLAQDENGVYVKEIELNTETQREGLLKSGDRLLWVNRKHVEKFSIDEVLRIIDASPNGSNIVITRWNAQQKKIEKQDKNIESEQETQMIPNLINTEEPYMFEVTYLTT
ncbi:uncharacterized protein [Clytia hemisphaerica]|uniref:PDZ domain-containing protein n=1 Tax=Clytia hemisphaerica TaxID=252671 RepID=A0A7M5WQM3_9CNID